MTRLRWFLIKRLVGNNGVCMNCIVNGSGDGKGMIISGKNGQLIGMNNYIRGNSENCVFRIA